MSNTDRSQATPHTLVLAGGPDAERPISIVSATAIADALRKAGHKVSYVEIERVTAEQLDGMPGEVIFPALHGPWGEGGPLQQVLVDSGRPFIGAGPLAARIAMDKVAAKLAAAAIGLATPPSHPLGASGSQSAHAALPLVIKPAAEGSSVGLHICRTEDEWTRASRIARQDAIDSDRVYLAEAMIKGRELTVPLIAPRPGAPLEALPMIEIVPASGVYDYEAKYSRSDTQYIIEPALDPDPEKHAQLVEQIQRDAVRIAEHLGVRHLARVDFMMPSPLQQWGDLTIEGPQFIELNTMPGFTSSSLLPKAADHQGMTFPQLCSHLVRLAAP